MRRIELDSITIENFRSFRAPTTVEFIPQGGLKFLTGVNEVEPRLGANGAGKSSLWDALNWCLTGYSTRGLRAGDLTSWGAQKAKVIVCFSIEGESARVERSSNPNRITIENKPCSQADIDSLLGLDRARFAQAVLFGQKVRSFADLTVPERGAIFDAMLDLSVWQRASEFADRKYKTIDAALNKLLQEKAYQQGALDGLRNDESLRASAARWDAEQAESIEKALSELEALESTLVDAQKEHAERKATAAALPSTARLLDEQTALDRQAGSIEGEYRRLFEDLTAAQESHKFYERNLECPACKQKITQATKAQHLSHLTNHISSLSAAIKNNGLAARTLTVKQSEKRGELEKLQRTRDFQLERLTIAEEKVHSTRRAIDAAAAYIEQMGQKSNPFLAQVAAAEEQVRAAQAALLRVEEAIDAARGEATQADFWRGAYKRVRLFETNRVLLQLQIEVNNAAILLGLQNWRILLKTEVETKSLTIRSGIQIVIESPEASAPWEAWSGGEGQRLQLATTVGLANMIQRLAGVDYGFEVWDEPSAWLSPEGIDDLLSCLQHRAATTGKAIWLSDHRGLVFSGFTEIWQVRKTQEGSRVELLRD